MKTRNAMQLKALINNKAKAAGVSPQLMLQNYMLERLIDRISRSSWRDCIIVKGGMLIGFSYRRGQAHHEGPRHHRERLHLNPFEGRRGVRRDLRDRRRRRPFLRAAAHGRYPRGGRVPGHPGVPARLLRSVGRSTHGRCDNRRQDHAQRHRVRVPVRIRRGLCDGHGLSAGNRDGREDRDRPGEERCDHAHPRLLRYLRALARSGPCGPYSYSRPGPCGDMREAQQLGGGRASRGNHR